MTLIGAGEACAIAGYGIPVGLTVGVSLGVGDEATGQPLRALFTPPDRRLARTVPTLTRLREPPIYSRKAA